MPVRGEESLELGVVGSRRERDLEERAALELDAGPQPADREKEHARHDEERREEEVPPLAFDKMEKHPSTLTNAREIAKSARHRPPPASTPPPQPRSAT